MNNKRLFLIKHKQPIDVYTVFFYNEPVVERYFSIKESSIYGLPRRFFNVNTYNIIFIIGGI